MFVGIRYSVLAMAAVSAVSLMGQDIVRGKVANPHGKLDIPCENCHTTTAWKPLRTQSEFNHSGQTGFPLRGLHQGVACKDCHVDLVFSKAASQCSQCHADLHRGQFGSKCEQCHTVQGWGVRTSLMREHNNRFPLLGAHAAVTCQDCHKGAAAGNYLGLSTACVTCHLNDYQNTMPLNHAAAGLPATCDSCHTMNGWQSARFDHAQFAHFALNGAHASLACAQCHVGNRFAGTAAACSGCHLQDYANTANPNHRTANFAMTCETCHTTANWQNATFDHSIAGFALTGAHASVQCGQCHTNNNFALTSAACWNCHQNDYNGANNPPHKASGFPQDCTLCHTTTNWTSATFNHATTGFVLTGAHLTTPCNACHVNNNYNFQLQAGASGCINCHLADYNAATNPNHKTANFPQDCSGCHTTSSWAGATFNHAATGFALAGVHASQPCAACHVNNNYNLTSGACWNCHQTDYNGATNPPHLSAAFPQDCTLCHGTAILNWTTATFNHTATGFALVGMHATQQCAACHANNNYNLTSGACWNCHQADYNGATSPPHQASGFPQDCAPCHGTAILNWTSATFNHTSTGFTLTGAHTSLQCAQCHVNNNYTLSGANTACYNCHAADYNGTTNPPHAAQGFPQDCSGCHTTTSWAGATFNHATTGFALTGFHTSMQCNQCHVNNNYSLTSGACWNCHQADYNGTANPAHQAAGFPQDCSMCHSTTNWSGATFAHPATPLQLTGYHATMLANNQCNLCHVGNNYTSTPSDCWSCHQTDYNTTTNPNHAAAGFAHTCNSCHTFVDWTGAQYTAHDGAYFPIYSGTHQGKWTACSDCHTNSSNYAVFTCIACHQHSSQAQVTQQHQGVNNFVYNGTSCYSCHPRGTGG